MTAVPEPPRKPLPGECVGAAPPDGSSVSAHTRNPTASEVAEARARCVRTLDEPQLPIDTDSQFLVASLGPNIFDRQALEALKLRASWKDVGNGVRLGRLAREGEAQLVLYEIPAGAPAEAFQEHDHPAGEVYMVAYGGITDESGSYGPGSFIWLGPRTVHTPRATEHTLILVFWPRGVRMTQR